MWWNSLASCNATIFDGSTMSKWWCWRQASRFFRIDGWSLVFGCLMKKFCHHRAVLGTFLLICFQSKRSFWPQVVKLFDIFVYIRVKHFFFDEKFHLFELMWWSCLHLVYISMYGYIVKQYPSNMFPCSSHEIELVIKPLRHFFWCVFCEWKVFFARIYSDVHNVCVIE